MKYLWLKAEWDKENLLIYEFIKDICVKTSRAWLIKEAFSCFWDYIYQGAALKYFDRWYFWATHSRLDPVIKVAKMLKRHLGELLDYFRGPLKNSFRKLTKRFLSIQGGKSGA